jgi:hypothetical protein
LDKKIDLFIEAAQKGIHASYPEGGIPYLTSDLEVLLYDDPNQRWHRDYTEESKDHHI